MTLFTPTTMAGFADELTKIAEEIPGLREHVRKSGFQSHLIPSAIGAAGIGTGALSLLAKSPYLKVPGAIIGAGGAAFGAFGNVMAAHYNKARRLAMKGVQDGLDDQELAKLKQLNPSLSMLDEMAGQASHRGYNVRPQVEQLLGRAGYAS